MSLTHPRFASNQRLQDAARNAPSMRHGERDRVAVAILQQALVDYGIPMPRSTRPDGSMDGGFGDDTEDAVKEFQQRNGLVDRSGNGDGVVGRDTMTTLDRVLPRTSAAAAGQTGDNRIYDAINLFKYSRVGQGMAHMGGDAAYRARYQRLAQDVLSALWRLWTAGEIRFSALAAAVIGDSHPGRPGPDIRINQLIEPSRNPLTYMQSAEQGKLAAASCNLVHEATHLVRGISSYPEEELLCRTIQQFYFRELRAGRSYDSRVTGTHLTAQYNSTVPYFASYAGRDVRLSSQDMVDNVFNLLEYRRDLEGEATASFIARSLPWWGGLDNRWPSTRGYFLRSLSAQDEDYSEAILQILESLDFAQWPAARSCAGDVDRIRRALRLSDHGGDSFRIGSTLSYDDPFSARVRVVQDRFGEAFGV